MSTPETAGLAKRRIAAENLDGVLRRQRPLEEQIDGGKIFSMPERDRGLTRGAGATERVGARSDAQRAGKPGSYKRRMTMRFRISLVLILLVAGIGVMTQSAPASAGRTALPAGAVWASSNPKTTEPPWARSKVPALLRVKWLTT